MVYNEGLQRLLASLLLLTVTWNTAYISVNDMNGTSLIQTSESSATHRDGERNVVIPKPKLWFPAYQMVSD